MNFAKNLSSFWSERKAMLMRVIDLTECLARKKKSSAEEGDEEKRERK